MLFATFSIAISILVVTLLGNLQAFLGVQGLLGAHVLNSLFNFSLNSFTPTRQPVKKTHLPLCFQVHESLDVQVIEEVQVHVESKNNHQVNKHLVQVGQ